MRTEGEDGPLGRVEVGVDGKEGLKITWVGLVGIIGVVPVDCSVSLTFCSYSRCLSYAPHLK